MRVIEVDQYDHRRFLGDWWSDAVDEVGPKEVEESRQPPAGFVWLAENADGMCYVWKASFDSSG